MSKIIAIVGSPDESRWPNLVHLPEYPEFARQPRKSSSLAHWYQVRSRSTAGYNLLTRFFEYDPAKRITAAQAMEHDYFVAEEPLASPCNAFEGSDVAYTSRRVTHEDNGDPKMGSQPAALLSLQQQQQQHGHLNHAKTHGGSRAAAGAASSIPRHLGAAMMPDAAQTTTTAIPPRKRTRLN